jgi:Amt family ammonium transporter
MVVLGTFLLWLGWVMFNGGSSGGIVGEDGSKTHLSAELAIMNTILAPAAGGLFTFLTRKHITGENRDIRLDFQALTNGMLAGLVAVTASCDCIEPWAAILTGIIGSVTYSICCGLMNIAQIDDPLEAFQVHGCCGVIGCITLAFFKIDDGILYGGKSVTDDEGNKSIAGWGLLGIQCLGCICIILWSGGVSAIFFYISKITNTLRLSEMDELLGGDLHYFGPMEFQGQLHEYDLADGIDNIVLKSARQANEDKAMNDCLELVSAREEE